MGSDDLSLTSDEYFSIRLEELLLHKKVKLLRQMNDLYQWCGQILEAKFLSLSLLTFGEPVSFSFWRMESGCIRASKGVFALRELPIQKESYEVRFHLLHQRWINSSPGNRTFPSRLKVQAFFKKEHHNNIFLMIGEFSVGLLAGTGTSRSIIRWELIRT